MEVISFITNSLVIYLLWFYLFYDEHTDRAHYGGLNVPDISIQVMPDGYRSGDD